MNDFIIDVGIQIKKYRQESGLSQDDLSKLSGIERSQISKIENGTLCGVTYSTIIKLYESLGLTLVPQKELLQFSNLHPFVKWAGGKTQLLDTIISHLPKTYNNYYEPFVGGGALLFKIQPNSFYINDVNSELICVYQCMESDDLFEKLKELLEIHESSHCEDYYYQIRNMDQAEDYLELPIYIRAARMIYLNKAGFNGLYRVNSKGYFNVPSGKHKKINCYDRNNFEELRAFFKTKSHYISNCDFEQAVSDAKPGDFVYFDPPYDPWEGKDSFTAYSKTAFGKSEQERLANVFKKLSDRGVYVMLSNHNTAYINELYSNFHIVIVPARRMINSKASGRGNVEEVLITNYEQLF